MMSNDKEEEFHDNWADEGLPADFDIIKANEACTSPEIRYITDFIDDFKGKSVLDVGCGFGEVSIYFALKGADVTAVDISQGMLNKVTELANTYNLKIETLKSSIEKLDSVNRHFDIIYAGNVLHHVNIEKSINSIKSCLKEGGYFISWDPLLYNPIINIYRKIAKDVRTDDEHPLALEDIRLIKDNFKQVKCEYFWFTTLTIFIIMFIFQRRNPNKERFWKTVVNESEYWRKFYIPLGFIDKILLKIFPFFKYLCWNIVIISQK